MAPSAGKLNFFLSDSFAETYGIALSFMAATLFVPIVIGHYQNELRKCSLTIKFGFATTLI